MTLVRAMLHTRQLWTPELDETDAFGAPKQQGVILSCQSQLQPIILDVFLPAIPGLGLEQISVTTEPQQDIDTIDADVWINVSPPRTAKVLSEQSRLFAELEPRVAELVYSTARAADIDAPLLITTMFGEFGRGRQRTPLGVITACPATC
jgi:hypothetical protein